MKFRCMIILPGRFCFCPAALPKQGAMLWVTGGWADTMNGEPAVLINSNVKFGRVWRPTE